MKPSIVFLLVISGAPSNIFGFVVRRSPVGTKLLWNFRASTDLSDEEGYDLIERLSKDIFESKPPFNPFEITRPSKSDLYNESDLQTLWDIHERNQQIIQLDQSTTRNNKVDETNILSMHDMILQSLGETTKQTNGAVVMVEPEQVDWMDDTTKQRIADVRAIASDVDGTLLTSHMTLHPRTKQAIQRAVAAAESPLEPLQWFFLATGKSQKGALNSLGPAIGDLLLNSPGVFLQGLYCVNHKGKVVFEKKLDSRAVDEVKHLVAEFQLSIVAYDGNELYTTNLTDSVRALHERYGEPLPTLLSGAIADHTPGMHKILLMDHDTVKLQTVVRPKLEILAAANNACVTQAIPTMLELLPLGCSKALGVQKLCEDLGIDMGTQLLALGDAENDVLMLQQASIGVAMGNASPIAKEAADFVMEETNNSGGAGAAIEVFGFGQILYEMAEPRW